MRHLSVPSRETEVWLALCRQRNWLASTGVQALEDDQRGIPLQASAPEQGDPVWEGRTIVEMIPKFQDPKHWMERLPTPLQELPESFWPASFETQGDVLIVKIEDHVRPHEEAMAEAMLAHFSNMRLVCADGGVEGDFRVRDLRVVSSKDGSTHTRTTVREHGHHILVDPGAVYFSSRLSTQRENTLDELRQFNADLGRPLVLADPYAGAGPSLPLLLAEPNLLQGWLVGDLNPDAFALLQENLNSWKKARPGKPSVDIAVCLDARDWKNEADLTGKADVLLVNLPHDSFAHLPDLFPLLAREDMSLLRGWAIVDRATLDQRLEQMQNLVIEAGGTPSASSVREIKGFSTTRCFVVFQCQITWG
jgi:tRNA G37 N-methylase Trm5